MQRLTQSIFLRTVPFLILFGVVTPTTSVLVQSQVLSAEEIIYNHPAAYRSRTIDTRYGQGPKTGTCEEMQPPLTAIVPSVQIEPEKFSVWGQTISDRPSLWFYVPYTTSGPDLELTLEDEAGQVINSFEVARPATSSLVQVQLPESVSPLQVNQLYRWRLQAKCSQRAIEVSGWIQRVATPVAMTSKVKTTNPQQLAQLYAANGLWYDALTVLGETQRKSGQSAAGWQSLLKQVGLESLATMPIAPKHP